MNDRNRRDADRSASGGDASPPRRSPWILGPWRDLVFIVATPLLIYSGIELAQGRSSIGAISTFAIIWAIGHHMPGMMRAYGDRELFRRFRVRFIVAPLFLLAVAVATTLWSLHAVFLLGMLWGWWHYLMQAYGFVRIYDAKVGSFAPSTQTLDKAMCLTWFAAPLLLSPDTLVGFLGRAYSCGLPLPPSSVVHFVRDGVLVLTVATTVLFMVNIAWRWSHGQPPNPVKLVLMVTTFAFYWYSVSTVKNLLVAYALFELFHDVQYLTIVWVFNRNRVRQDRTMRGFTPFVFRPRLLLVGLYLAIIAAYGSLEPGVRAFTEGPLQSALLGIFVASALLHYYYDGFIWKLREGSTRKSLDIETEAGSTRPRLALPRWARHALLWALFVLPLAGLTATELRVERERPERTGTALSISKLNVNEVRGRTVEEKKSRALLASVPDAAVTRLLFADALEAAGRDDEAIEQYRLGLEDSPGRFKAHNKLGGLLQKRGDLEAAARRYEEALRLEPDYADAHYNLANVRASGGDAAGAREHYEAAVRLDPANARARNNLGILDIRENRAAEAAAWFREALEIDAGYVEARLNLASVAQLRGNDAEATAQYRLVLERAAPAERAAIRAAAGLGWILATATDPSLRDGAEAVRLAEGAVANGGRLPLLLDVLAAAYAEEGRFEEAVATAEEALDLARGAAPGWLSVQIDARLRLFRSGQAYRGPQGGFP
jgi:tetratricopeptide (TPR) repeat protein